MDGVPEQKLMSGGWGRLVNLLHCPSQLWRWHYDQHVTHHMQSNAGSG
jgi:hypothetical protein